MGQSLHVQASHFPVMLQQRKIQANAAIVIIIIIITITGNGDGKFSRSHRSTDVFIAVSPCLSLIPQQ